MMSNNKIHPNLNYKFNQLIGQEQSHLDIQQEDVITTLQFDPTGSLLAIGDYAGRIIIFKNQKKQTQQNNFFNYYAEFQSHTLQFDTLKSLRMTESIKTIKWLKPQGKYNKMITANGHRIKLYKIFQKQSMKKTFSSKRFIDPFQEMQDDLAIPILQKQPVFTSKPQINFPIKHSGIINSVQVTNNQQFLFSSDQNHALLWNFQKYESPFVIEDINTKKYLKQSQKISCSQIHPFSDNIFMFGTTKGTIQLSDTRIAFNNRKNLTFLSNPNIQINHNFTEMTKNINALNFLKQGKYIVSRDYLTIKVWDIMRSNQPLKIIATNKKLTNCLSSLFQQECFQDDFNMSLIQNNIVTGSYDNRFNVIDPLSGENIQYQMGFTQKNCKQIPLNLQDNQFQTNFNINRKIKRTCVHEQSKKIALASLNSVFIYHEAD